jgi:Uma2 family endonuclease
MVLYDGSMATQVDLPDEAPDVTASELHVAVLRRLAGVLCYLFRDQALVLNDVFVRVNGAEQVSPDVMIVHGAEPGTRTVYRIPPEPVPDVTIEVLSTVNRQGEGRRLLEQKRRLLGVIGVPLHIELDPERGLLAIWHNVRGQLVPDPPTDRYDGEELGGLRIDLTPGEVELRLPDGRTFTDVGDEIDRANREARRADDEAKRARDEAKRADDEAKRARDEAKRADDEARRAEQEARRAARLAEALRAAGIDPDSV